MKGTYVLITKLKKDSKIKIGKLGLVKFPKGYYCYVGSALGKSVNLENRIKRHKRLVESKSGNLHWHVDYFLTHPNVELIRVQAIGGEERMECRISDLFSKFSEDSVEDFGSSDCNCQSHLFYFRDEKYDEVLERLYK